MSDKELIKIVSSFRKGILGKESSYAKCVMVCLPLQGYLATIGIQSSLVNFDVATKVDGFWSHTCLELKDGRILDPTADQFTPNTGDKLPVVYLGNKPTWFLKQKQ